MSGLYTPSLLSSDSEKEDGTYLINYTFKLYSVCSRYSRAQLHSSQRRSSDGNAMVNDELVTNLTFKVMDAEQALRWCSAADDWHEFSQRVLEAIQAVNLSFLSDGAVQDVDNVQSFIDWRYVATKSM